MGANLTIHISVSALVNRMMHIFSATREKHSKYERDNEIVGKKHTMRMKFNPEKRRLEFSWFLFFYLFFRLVFSHSLSFILFYYCHFISFSVYFSWVCGWCVGAVWMYVCHFDDIFFCAGKNCTKKKNHTEFNVVFPSTTHIDEENRSEKAF